MWPRCASEACVLQTGEKSSDLSIAGHACVAAASHESPRVRAEGYTCEVRAACGESCRVSEWWAEARSGAGCRVELALPISTCRARLPSLVDRLDVSISAWVANAWGAAASGRSSPLVARAKTGSRAVPASASRQPPKLDAPTSRRHKVTRGRRHAVNVCDQCAQVRRIRSGEMENMDGAPSWAPA